MFGFSNAADRQKKGAPSSPVDPLPWRIIWLGALNIIFLAAFVGGLVVSVSWKKWIGAQISLVGIVVILALSAWQLRRLILARAAKALNKDVSDYGVATIVRLLQFTGFGVAAILVYAIQRDHWVDGQVAEIASVGLLTAGASLASGAFLGFLFGVPKSSQTQPSENGAKPSGSSPTSGSDDDQKQPYGANTNLEQISDWLTKTIVGVSLVQLYKLPPFLGKLSTFVAAGLDGDPTTTRALALVIMVYFVSTGFLTSYLWTRMELTRAFNASALGRRLGRLERQSKLDASALVSVDRWINHPEESQQSSTDMMDAIKAASSLIRARIFLTTEEFREKPPATDKLAIQNANNLSLPIFQALVEADVEKTFHRNRGQYAFTLMTQTIPNWPAALAMIEEAITIRDRGKEPGWKEYEFARAVCKIHVNTLPKAKADLALKAAIDADLQGQPQPLDEKLDDKRLRLDLDRVVTAWLAAPVAAPTSVAPVNDTKA
jgi:hypothetical protein